MRWLPQRWEEVLHGVGSRAQIEMPGEGAYLVSDYCGEPVGVLCEDCELLKFISSAELMIEFGDLSMPTMLRRISQEVIKCARPMDGYSGRCMLHYHVRSGSQIDALKQCEAAGR
ncbi:hypothetical protein [Agrobacterium sp. B1(2019)]|uniref:hypothetical protein n=1 Tax=Agrobacterium sp. B1(2019) TaxID=2607032 RepID=UPI001FEF025E|nr:hypothetical protein [Agrobacterium sp. B1(2019)]